MRHGGPYLSFFWFFLTGQQLYSHLEDEKINIKLSEATELENSESWVNGTPKPKFLAAMLSYPYPKLTI